MQVILCFVLSALLGTFLLFIVILVRRFRRRPPGPGPSTTDLDTVDDDLEIVPPPEPLPEPQFLSGGGSEPPRYPTLGRGTKILRNSEYTATPSPARDSVVRYSTIGRQRVSPPGMEILEL